MGAASSHSVLFGQKKKQQPAVFRTWSGLRGALRIKTPKKKKNNNSLLTLHGWRLKKQKKQKREGPFKSWLPLAGKSKKKTNQSFDSSTSPKKDSVFKPLPTRRKGGTEIGSGKEKETKVVFSPTKVLPDRSYCNLRYTMEHR